MKEIVCIECGKTKKIQNDCLSQKCDDCREDGIYIRTVNARIHNEETRIVVNCISCNKELKTTKFVNKIKTECDDCYEKRISEFEIGRTKVINEMKATYQLKEDEIDVVIPELEKTNNDIWNSIIKRKRKLSSSRMKSVKQKINIDDI